STYDELKLSQFRKDTLAFLPVLVSLDDGKKAVITEADLRDYPGMYLGISTEGNTGLHGVFARYPAAETVNARNLVVTRRENFIAKTSGQRSFPWRVVIIGSTDKELANNDMVQKLAPASVIADPSWIKPGKVAWDWWNDW